MKKALTGKHVLITRPAHQAEKLVQLIEQHGGIAVRFPTMDIVGIATQTDSDLNHQDSETFALPLLSNFRWVIFVSANAVNFALKAIGGKIAQFEATQIAVIGQATAQTLESVGLKPALMPDQGFDSEAMLSLPPLQSVDQQDILIVRGRGGREELANVLRSRGANVRYWEVYERVMPEIDTSEVVGLLKQGLLDVITVTSSEALQNLVVLLGHDDKYRLTIIPLVVISERISQLAAQLGFKRIEVAERPSDSAILDKLISEFGHGNT